MFLAVKDYLAQHETIVSALPNYPAYLSAFQAAISTIKTYSEQQMFSKAALKSDKAKLKTELILIAADVSRKLHAYAKFAGNQLLINETRFTESDLRKSGDNVLNDETQGIYDRAQTNLPSLFGYGINEASQEKFRQAIYDFVCAIPKPRLGTAARKQETVRLGNAFTTASEALNNIETLIEVIRSSEPGFFSGFKTVNKLIINAGRSICMRGVVTDSATLEPVKGATVMITPNGNGDIVNGNRKMSEIAKRTADKGGFHVRTLPAGTYRVSIKKPGYASQETSVAIAVGELSVLKIKLSKN